MGRGLPGEEEKRSALSSARSVGPAPARAQGEHPLLSKPRSRCELISASPSIPYAATASSADVAPSYSTALRIIKHIEPHQSCDWLISKELTN